MSELYLSVFMQKGKKTKSDMKLITSMGMTNLCLCLITLAMVHFSVAQNTQEDYLSAHNSARAQVFVDPLVWDDTVAAYAQNFAIQLSATCGFEHSNGPYGENLAESIDSSLTATAAVNMWVDELQYYDYNSNTCAVGQVCGHYTQVVWRNSVRLGCARVLCTTGATIITCNYDPPGNYVGEKPY